MEATPATEVNPYLQFVGAIVPALMSAAIAWVVATWRVRKKASRELRTSLANIEGSLNLIREQVFTNGGASLRDAINRIEANQAIQAAFQWAHHDHESTPIWESDSSCAIRQSNPAFAKLLGVSVEEMKAYGWMSMIHEDDLDGVKQEIEDGQRFGRNLHINFRAHLPGNRKDLLRVETRWRRVTGHNGNTVGYAGTVLNSQKVTARGND